MQTIYAVMPLVCKYKSNLLGMCLGVERRKGKGREGRRRTS